MKIQGHARNLILVLEGKVRKNLPESKILQISEKTSEVKYLQFY